MSQLYVDNIKGRTGGPVALPQGAVVTGIVTATSFSGDGSNLSGINRLLSIQTRVGIVTVTAFSGILTVFGRTSNTSVLV